MDRPDRQYACLGYARARQMLNMKTFLCLQNSRQGDEIEPHSIALAPTCHFSFCKSIIHEDFKSLGPQL